MVAVKITVLKRALHSDLAKAHSDSDIKPCELFHEGQSFISAFNRPDGFCDWAWNDISKMFLAVLSGGHFDRGAFKGWMKDGDSAVACCTDGYRPVTFKLERIDTSSLIDLSGVESPAPPEVYDCERWGEFSYRIPGFEPREDLRVRLHFCEVYHSDAGKRRFQVECGGRRVLEDFDILAEAGGRGKAIVREFRASADADGKLAINFAKGAADMPKISAIEIFRGKAERISAINSGGGDCGDYMADCFYSGGNG